MRHLCDDKWQQNITLLIGSYDKCNIWVRSSSSVINYFSTLIVRSIMGFFVCLFFNVTFGDRMVSSLSDWVVKSFIIFPTCILSLSLLLTCINKNICCVSTSYFSLVWLQVVVNLSFSLIWYLVASKTLVFHRYFVSLFHLISHLLHSWFWYLTSFTWTCSSLDRKTQSLLNWLITSLIVQVIWMASVRLSEAW